MKKGLLIVVSAPSGCGKGTVLSAVQEKRKFFYSVSATTRPPRPGDKDGVNYYFLDREEFENRINNGTMLEYAVYCDNYYGTPSDPVMAHINKGEDVVLEIEVKGAMQVKEKYPEAVLVFILPPSVDELRRRLYKRGTETPEIIEERVSKAAEEIGYAYRYDHVILNDVAETAAQDMIGIIDAEKTAAFRCHDLIDDVLNKGDNLS
ncbi:MAG: guanylate kinase [Oscillospiraceae bacterium]|nr:guanylate kinase [Oscillospiraceae bacterium]